MTDSPARVYPVFVQLMNSSADQTNITIDAVSGTAFYPVADLDGGELTGSEEPGFLAVLYDDVARTTTGERVALAAYRLVNVELIGADIDRTAGAYSHTFTAWLLEIRHHGHGNPFPDGPYGNTEPLPPVVDDGDLPFRVQMTVTTTVTDTPETSERPHHDH